MRHLDLFSGIGGFALAAKWTGKIETIAFCEIDDYCGKVLNKNFPGVQVHKDIKTLKNEGQYGTIDIITGGFPCQPFSVAGKQKGKRDDRYLWPEMLRVIQEFKPTWVLGENVAGIINLGLEQVLSDLEGEGYECQPLIIPACAKDASHRRDRVWILSNTRFQPKGCEKKRFSDKQKHSEKKRFKTKEGNRFTNLCEDVANTKSKQGGGIQLEGIQPNLGASSENVPNSNQFNDDNSGFRASNVSQLKASGIQEMHDVCNSPIKGFQNWAKKKMGKQGSEQEFKRSNRWAIEPSVGRVAHGISGRVDRLKGLGNAIVPQVAFEILNSLR